MALCLALNIVLEIYIRVPYLITSEREARSEFLPIYTKNLSMSGRPAVVTLLGRLISLEP